MCTILLSYFRKVLFAPALKSKNGVVGVKNESNTRGKFIKSQSPDTFPSRSR